LAKAGATLVASITIIRATTDDNDIRRLISAISLPKLSEKVFHHKMRVSSL
jgi:hypothetical protein